MSCPTFFKFQDFSGFETKLSADIVKPGSKSFSSLDESLKLIFAIEFSLRLTWTLYSQFSCFPGIGSQAWLRRASRRQCRPLPMPSVANAVRCQCRPLPMPTVANAVRRQCRRRPRQLLLRGGTLISEARHSPPLFRQNQFKLCQSISFANIF